MSLNSKLRVAESLVNTEHRRPHGPVSFVVNDEKVHEQDVFGCGIHPGDLHLEGWKHSPVVFQT